MYLIPKGIGEQTAESLLGISYLIQEYAGSQAGDGLKEARTHSLNLCLSGNGHLH